MANSIIRFGKQIKYWYRKYIPKKIRLTSVIFISLLNNLSSIKLLNIKLKRNRFKKYILNKLYTRQILYDTCTTCINF